MGIMEPFEQAVAIAGKGGRLAQPPARLEITRLDVREVVQGGGEIDRPWTEVRLNVYLDRSHVVLELSRRRRGNSPEAIGLMLNADDARKLVRMLAQAVRSGDVAGAAS